MNDSTIRLSADTSALTDSLSKIAEEMTAMKDAVSSSATAMGVNFYKSLPARNQVFDLRLDTYAHND